MILEVITGGLLLLALVNLWLSWRAVHDRLATPMQRVVHVLLIWAVPVLGAMLVVHFQRSHPERSSGRYRDNPDSGDDFAASGANYRRTMRAIENGPGDAVD